MFNTYALLLDEQKIIWAAVQEKWREPTLELLRTKYHWTEEMIEEMINAELPTKYY